MIKPDSDFFSAILFDMDGTLVDTEPMWLASEIELMSRYGYIWTESDQAQCLGGPLDRVGEFMFGLAGKVETPEFFTTTLISLMEGQLRSGARLLAGAQDLMSLCKELEVPTALVSASPRVLVDAVLANLADHSFDVSISADDVSKVKPDPEGYLKAAEFLEVPIEDCLILEDSITGVAAARASGANVIAIPHLVEIPRAEKLHIVTSVSELTHHALRDLFKKFVLSPQTPGISL